PGQPVPDCDLLFVSTHDREEITQALASASGRPILTVGDADDFLSAGGMIAMEREGDGIRFNVNLNNTRAMGFQVSGAMLQSANRIYDGSRIIKH
ncbi:MAG TPA: YfiR family protein, partial [Verrucomicrobiae bacterium]